MANLKNNGSLAREATGRKSVFERLLQSESLLCHPESFTLAADR
jgi:hypothetical protein